MSKEFVKGVTIRESEPEAENTQQVGEYETDTKDTQALMRANEEDFIQGLIAAAEFVSEETQRIEIIRDKRLFFAFNIRPLSSQEYEKCKRKHTKYVRNKQLGMKQIGLNTNLPLFMRRQWQKIGRNCGITVKYGRR